MDGSSQFARRQFLSRTLMLVLGMMLTGLLSLQAGPRMYVSHASLEIAKAEPCTQAAHPDYMGAQVELLVSGDMMRRALLAMQLYHPDLKQHEVTIHGGRSKIIPSVVLVDVSCEDAKYAEVFLGSLLTEFLAWHKQYHEKAFGSAINDVILETVAAEKRVKSLDDDVKVGRALGHSPAQMEVPEAKLALGRESEETLKKKLFALNEDFKKLPPDAVVKQPATPAESQ
jgi:hypothetical protein